MTDEQNNIGMAEYLGIKLLKPRETLAETRARFTKGFPYDAVCIGKQREPQFKVCAMWQAFLKGAGFNGDEPFVEGK